MLSHLSYGSSPFGYSLVLQMESQAFATVPSLCHQPSWTYTFYNLNECKTGSRGILSPTEQLSQLSFLALNRTCRERKLNLFTQAAAGDFPAEGGPTAPVAPPLLGRCLGLSFGS
jgi:hypothetical protein